MGALIKTSTSSSYYFPAVSPSETALRHNASVTEPVIVKHRFAIACVALLQVVAPAAVVVGTLYTLLRLFGLPLERNIQALGAFSALLTVLMSVRRSQNASILWSRISLAFGVVYRWGVVLAILLAVGYASKVTEGYSRRLVLSWAVITPLLLVALALALDKVLWRLLRDPSNARKTVFVGSNEISEALARQLATRRDYCMAVEGFFDDRSADRLQGDVSFKLLGRLQDLAAYVKEHGVHVIFVSLPMRHLQRVRTFLDELRDTTASIYYLPDVFVFDLIQSRTGEIAGMPVIALCETPFYGFRGVVKRFMDFTISGAALLLLAPVMLAIAVAVRASSPGPVIFRQRRYGLDGREFIVYKFRTMNVTEDGGDIVQASREDQRVTRVGRFLRRRSLDELPQLINVLQGRMSLVGPRPHAIAHNEVYRKLIKGYMIRHKVPPGITGLAQINGCRGETAQLEEMQARVQYDLEYLRHWSPALDVKILAKTVLQLLRDDKAY
jgi:putative colanic acid biosynthesis UDP-glucose lipid carrier transferase